MYVATTLYFDMLCSGLLQHHQQHHQQPTIAYPGSHYSQSSSSPHTWTAGTLTLFFLALVALIIIIEYDEHHNYEADTSLQAA